MNSLGPERPCNHDSAPRSSTGSASGTVGVVYCAPMVECHYMRNLPIWIQSLADLAIAVVTTWTLIILRRYAADTKIIAKNSSEQIESAQMPFVVLVLGREASRPWLLRNQGSGTALNIYFTRFVSQSSPPRMQWMTPLAPGQEIAVDRESALLTQESGFRVEYESLSGKKYRTLTKDKDGDLKTTFNRIE